MTKFWRTPLNTLSKYTFGSILFASVLVLPACGSKNSVKSETPGQNIVQPAQTPGSTIEPYKETTIISDSADSKPVRRVHAYSEKSSDVQNQTAVASSEKPTPVATPAAVAAPVNAQPEKKSGSKWLWILIAVAALGGGYYLYAKKSPRRKGHPLPPMGGLSPVSGFTAMKDKVQSSKPSFWTKKLF
jgi:hypothetical protein